MEVSPFEVDALTCANDIVLKFMTEKQDGPENSSPRAVVERQQQQQSQAAQSQSPSTTSLSSAELHMSGDVNVHLLDDELRKTLEVTLQGCNCTLSTFKSLHGDGRRMQTQGLVTTDITVGLAEASYFAGGQVVRGDTAWCTRVFAPPLRIVVVVVAVVVQTHHVLRLSVWLCVSHGTTTVLLTMFSS